MRIYLFPGTRKVPFANQNHSSTLSPRHYTQQGSVSTGVLACWKPKDHICETKISRSSLKLENETYRLFFTTWTSSVYRDALLCPGIFGHTVCFTINCNFLNFYCFLLPFSLIQTSCTNIFLIYFMSFPITPSQLSTAPGHATMRTHPGDTNHPAGPGCLFPTRFSIKNSASHDRGLQPGLCIFLQNPF